MCRLTDWVSNNSAACSLSLSLSPFSLSPSLSFSLSLLLSLSLSLVLLSNLSVPTHLQCTFCEAYMKLQKKGAPSRNIDSSNNNKKSVHLQENEAEPILIIATWYKVFDHFPMLSTHFQRCCLDVGTIFLHLLCI